MKESGYFDATSQEKWLLHTWSLSVEWQFYIIYPIVLLAFKRFFSLETLKRIILIGTILGFILCVTTTMKSPDSAYYLLYARGWEMMLGGLAYLYPWQKTKQLNKGLEVIGLLFILSSFVFLNDQILWPGYWALLPVLGTFLVITANQQSSFLTNNIILQHLGRWSYSIYLWHWPLVVFGFYFNLPHWSMIGICLSVFLGYLSFTFIEGYHFKMYERWSEVTQVRPLRLALFVILISLIVKWSDGFAIRNSELNALTKKYGLSASQ